MTLNTICTIFIYVFLIISFILFANFIIVFISRREIEGFTIQDDTIVINKSEAFCESHRGSSGSLDMSCSKLTNKNCNSTSCCVWTSDNKCLAGGPQGPTFNTDSNGKTNMPKYYYFEKKCYGIGCPKSV